MTDPKRSATVSAALLALMLGVLALGGCAQRSPTDTVGDPRMARISEPPLVAAQVPIQLRTGHPQRYVVQPGDTLWGIASRFLQSPWRWQEIWQHNPSIGNPHLIYPGDVLELYYEGESPRLRLTRSADASTTSSASGGRPIIKLTPQVRVEPLDQPIPTVPRDAISSFMSKSRVVSNASWETQPYIIAGETDRINFLRGDRIYVRGGAFLDRPLYQIFRPGQSYQDPVTGQTLGFQLEYLGDATPEEVNSDPTVMRILNTTAGIQIGDRLFEPNNDNVVFQFLPKPAPPDLSGHIITPINGGFLVGRNESVVISIGEIDGIQPGHVLVTEVEGQTVKDPVTGEAVLLPSERSGVVMVYEVFDQVSYALVMEAGRTIRIGDSVGSPL